MDVAFYIETDEVGPYLFKKVWGIPLVRRVWLTWKRRGCDHMAIIVPSAFAERIRREFSDPFWLSSHIDILKYADRSEFEDLLKKYPMHFPLNAVFTTKKFIPTTLVEGQVSVKFDNTNIAYIMINTKMDVKIAEKVLAESIRSEAPTWVAREINKRISLRISYLLAKTSITPNQISFINLLLALTASIFAMRGTPIGFIVAGLLFQLNSILDGSDGELARLTFRSSEFGRKLDIIVDYISILIFTVGVAIGIYRSNPTYVLWVGNTLIFLFLLLLFILGCLFRHSPARHMILEDEENFLHNVIPNGPNKSLIDHLYLILFSLSRRDSYILIICLLSWFSGTVVYWFLVFLYLDTLLAAYLSVRRVENLLAAPHSLISTATSYEKIAP